MENSPRTKWEVTSLFDNFLSFVRRSNLTKNDTPSPDLLNNISPQVKEIYKFITNAGSETEEDIAKLFQGDFSVRDFDVKFKDRNTLIHEAVIYKKPKILEKLLSTYEFNINDQNEKGDTPMISLLKACVQCGEKYWEKSERNGQRDDHENENENTNEEKAYICEEHFQCLQILRKKNTETDIKNKLGLNAVSYATMCPPKQRVQYFTILFNEKIAKQINQLYKYLSSEWDSSLEKELQKCEIKQEIVNFMWKDKTGEYTLLQITCRLGMIKSMKFLLKNGAKIDDASTQKGNKNLFHIVVTNTTNSKKALECLKFLLKSKKNIGSINKQDNDGKTPLHYAVLSDEDDCIVELLKNGASLFIQDNWMETPLMNISRSAFKKFLDNMITDSRFKETPDSLKPNNESCDKQLRSITINFEKLILKKKRFKENSETNYGNNQTPSQNEKDSPSMGQQAKIDCPLSKSFKKLLIRSPSEEINFAPQNDTDETVCAMPTKFLCKIKDSKELQKLLAHPVFSIIIYFKWLKCRPVFLTCQILFLFFGIVYTYFLVTYEQISDFRSKSVLLDVLNNSLKNRNQKKVSILKASDIIQNALLFLLSILIIIFLFLEILKLIYQKIKYFSYTSNVLRVLGICLSSAVLIKINACSCNELKAISILITWLDFAFTVGEYPSLALYISIFRRALLRLMQFLIVYSGLLVGFALSFHFLFGSKNKEFFSVFDAFFKTLGILSGDFGADNVPFNLYPATSHLIFTLYIFVTTLILINIMSEMIAKVKILSENYFLHKMLAQVDIIKHYEDNYMKNKFIIKIGKYIRRKKKEDVNGHNIEDDGFIFKIILNGKKHKLKHHIVFENYPQEKVRIIKVSEKKNKIQKVLGSLDFVGLFEGVDDIIIQKAKKIIKKKSKTNEKSKKDDQILSLDIFTKEINGLKQKISLLKKLNQKQDRSDSRV